MVALGWLSSSKREKAKKASKQRPRRERGGGGEGPNVFQFLTTCMVQATKTMTMATAHSSMVVCWPTLLPSLRPFFFTEGQKLKTTPLLVAVLDSCKALPMAKPTGCRNPLPRFCSCSRQKCGNFLKCHFFLVFFVHNMTSTTHQEKDCP